MPIVEIKPSLCTGCGACVEICPLDVLRLSEEVAPVIAYQEDCQSCYLCTFYCPGGAIVVTPDRGRPSPLPY
jgi:NAD-dependent dihydropyrimidine dehydrogenase PreA subunit